MKSVEIKNRLEYLRGELVAERISYGELDELQSLKNHIDQSDTFLMEAAGIEEGAEPIGYAVHACNGIGFLATQGREMWFQDTPDGWALFSTEEGARDQLERHHSALGTKTEDGGEVIPVFN